MGGAAVFLVAAWLLLASVAGKLAGVHLAGRILQWQPGEASLIGWLLQTKALIMIIFANILLDKKIITSDNLHRDAVDGRGQHDADHPDGHAEVEAPAGPAEQLRTRPHFAWTMTRTLTLRKTGWSCTPLALASYSK